jgi:hypothetical protein
MRLHIIAVRCPSSKKWTLTEMPNCLKHCTRPPSRSSAIDFSFLKYFMTKDAIKVYGWLEKKIRVSWSLVITVIGFNILCGMTWSMWLNQESITSTALPCNFSVDEAICSSVITVVGLNIFGAQASSMSTFATDLWSTDGGIGICPAISACTRVCACSQTGQAYS